MKTIAIPTVKSLYIEMYFRDIKLSSGTAFLAVRNKESHCALITARHNLTGRDQFTNKCISKTQAIPDNIKIYFHKTEETVGDEWRVITLPLYKDDGIPWWIEHPTLAVHADIAALNLKWGSDVVKFPYYFDNDLDRFNIIIDPSEKISVIGFPFGIGSHQKLPVWTTGFMAQDIALVSDDNPVFLIDCRSRQGQSGSPVIAYRASGYRRNNNGKISYVVSPNPAWEFLGIYSERINSEPDIGRVWNAKSII